MKNIHRTIVFSGLSLFALVSVLINTYKSSQTFQKYFYINPLYFLLLFIIYSLVLRIKYDYQFPKLAVFLNNYFLLPVSAIISVSLTLVDFYTPPNWVFERYALNYEQVAFIALASLALMLISISDKWWRGNYQKIVFISASFLFIVFVLIRLWPFDFFKVMVLEDGLVEWAQFFAVLISGILSLIIAKDLFKSSKLLSVLYLLFALGLFFIAGDEIAWGQRLLNFQTPEKMNTYNLQGELTVHNLTTVTDFTWIGYMLVSIYGAFSWLLIHVIPNKLKKYAEFFTIPWYVSGYFIFSLIYHSFGKPGETNIARDWAEVSELMMYLGIFFYCLFIYLIYGKKVIKENSN